MIDDYDDDDHDDDDDDDDGGYDDDDDDGDDDVDVDRCMHSSIVFFCKRNMWDFAGRCVFAGRCALMVEFNPRKFQHVLSYHMRT